MNRSTRERRAQTAHACPIAGCPSWKPGDLLMCGPHWRMVPPSLKRRVWQAWEGGAGLGTQELRVAQTQAILAVEARHDPTLPAA